MMTWIEGSGAKLVLGGGTLQIRVHLGRGLRDDTATTTIVVETSRSASKIVNMAVMWLGLFHPCGNEATS